MPVGLLSIHRKLFISSASMLVLLSYISSALILVTKLADCLTTLHGIRYAHQERNRLVRGWMARFGIAKVIWGVYLMIIAIVILSQYILVKYFNDPLSIVGYILTALFISYTHLAVAHTNHTRKLNVFTRWLSSRRHYNP